MDLTKTVAAMGSAIRDRELLKAGTGMSLRDAWGVLGLASMPSSRSHFWPAPGVGRFTISGAVGAGIALFLPASAGRRLRARLAVRVDQAKRRVNDRISHLESVRRQRHAIS